MYTLSIVGWCSGPTIYMIIAPLIESSKYQVYFAANNKTIPQNRNQLNSISMMTTLSGEYRQVDGHLIRHPEMSVWIKCPSLSRENIQYQHTFACWKIPILIKAASFFVQRKSLVWKSGSMISSRSCFFRSRMFSTQCPS